jgi:hypothetical protein
MVKRSSRQHEHTSQCDGPAWLMSEQDVVNFWFPFIDGVKPSPPRQGDPLGEVYLPNPFENMSPYIVFNDALSGKNLQVMPN